MRTELPGPFDRRVWRSPLRGPWLASALSLGLLALFTIDLVTGYLSYVAYQPQLGANGITGGGLDRHLFGWTWPTDPAWLYGVTQGLHVLAGTMALPILAAKLWTVMPKLYKWPPALSIADALERASLGLLVGSSIFLLVTGLINIAYWYKGLGFGFVSAHFYAAFVFAGSFASHVIVKTPVMVRALRRRGALRPLRESLATMAPEPYDGETSAPLAPTAPTVTRRAMLAGVGGASLALGALLAGESFGGGLRATALLAPRGQDPGSGPNAFQVNKTAARAGIGPGDVGPDWRLTLTGARRVELSRAELEAMPQHTYELPINCVEGWSTSETWTGVRLRDLARLAGVTAPGSARVESIQRGGQFRQATLGAGQVGDERALLALKVNGADLALDHGYPARAIVPGAPGVHNTKWVASLAFAAR